MKDWTHPRIANPACLMLEHDDIAAEARAAFTRRREIGIMRLVGASRTYIMLPSLLESLTVALGGATLACATLAAVQQFAIVEKAKPALQGFAWIGWNNVGISMLGVVVVAIALSMIPTLVATRRFLKV